MPEESRAAARRRGVDAGDFMRWKKEGSVLPMVRCLGRMASEKLQHTIPNDPFPFVPCNRH
jgi:hypothetical protein